MLLYLFIQHVFIEYLLCARYCFRHWGHTIVNMKVKGRMQLPFCGTTDGKEIDISRYAMVLGHVQGQPLGGSDNSNRDKAGNK